MRKENNRSFCSFQDLKNFIKNARFNSEIIGYITTNYDHVKALLIQGNYGTRFTHKSFINSSTYAVLEQINHPTIKALLKEVSLKRREIISHISEPELKVVIPDSDSEDHSNSSDGLSPIILKKGNDTALLNPDTNDDYTILYNAFFFGDINNISQRHLDNFYTALTNKIGWAHDLKFAIKFSSQQADIVKHAWQIKQKIAPTQTINDFNMFCGVIGIEDQYLSGRYSNTGSPDTRSNSMPATTYSTQSWEQSAIPLPRQTQPEPVIIRQDLSRPNNISEDSVITKLRSAFCQNRTSIATITSSDITGFNNLCKVGNGYAISLRDELLNGRGKDMEAKLNLLEPNIEAKVFTTFCANIGYNAQTPKTSSLMYI